MIRISYPISCRSDLAHDIVESVTQDSVLKNECIKLTQASVSKFELMQSTSFFDIRMLNEMINQINDEYKKTTQAK